MKNLKDFDTRVVQRNIKKKNITDKDYADYLRNLEDSQGNCKELDEDSETEAMPTLEEYQKEDN
ncbi:MAG: hypothetical protein JXA66_04220 [Oligoflexia bacterium]|nr:hypothetical protein [Oligoflexia bacterium]